eukprot:9906891-Lingulodinium_polyedra.AAC.1
MAARGRRPRQGGGRAMWRRAIAAALLQERRQLGRPGAHQALCAPPAPPGPIEHMASALGHRCSCGLGLGHPGWPLLLGPGRNLAVGLLGVD